ncbi:DUF2786 domain-containing protein [Streptomyces cavernicola]|uniref:DUF2786 domain-containing protein n=1 Tax=Streptomyces cavernicola TaxID=3043613 RepID=A0ABT6SEY6_9ACTN|nr:DUF2786 domain-containing protein [Streptomyces sp. B-S-A6]MDI3406760.1 DUF2786 domain-containing protein [Streptomyces sp. B-S-A6]
MYAEGDEGVDTGAALLTADPEHAREALRRGQEFVRSAWQRGWQPADVIRLVRRELEERHAAIAAELIRDEVRRYASQGLPPRWQEQLDELPGPAPRGDRFLYAGALLELYRLLLRLPALEPVGPAPGTPVHARVEHAEPKLLARIRALLAKAEATGYPEEAEALTAKAQELMARQGVDEALLAHRTHAPDTPAARRIGVDAPYEAAKAILLDAVAGANRCRAVWNEAFGFSTVVGFETDLDSVELLHTSLLVQATSAMTEAEAAQRAGGRTKRRARSASLEGRWRETGGRTKTFRQSFLLAYAHRIAARLDEAADHGTAAARDEAGAAAADLLPVLAARDVAVGKRTDEMFPETTSTRVRSAQDAAGWHEGTAAADRAGM